MSAASPHANVRFEAMDHIMKLTGQAILLVMLFAPCLGSAPGQSPSSPPVSSAPQTATPNLTFTAKDFSRTLDSLKDVKETKLIVARANSAVTSAVLELPGKPKFLAVRTKATGVELVGTGTSGRVATLGTLQPTGTVVYWSWARILGNDFQPALQEFDALTSEMTIVAKTAADTLRFRMGSPASGPSDLVSGATVTLGPESIAGIRSAIAAAEASYQAEATEYSKKVAADLAQKADAIRDAKEKAREGRNDQQRDHELNGYWDDYGRWHPPNGHSSNNRDRGARGEMYRGSRIGPAGQGWGAVMQREVDAEKKADPAAGLKETKLVPAGDSIDCKEVSDYIAKKREGISDARIKGLLEIIRRELANPKPT